MVEHCNSTRLVKTTTQLYGLPHAKAKVQCSLFHKIMELSNTGDNYKWAHKLWLDRFLTNHMQDKGHWLWVWDSELRTTRYCWGGNNNCLAIRHAFETHIISCDLCHCKHLVTHVDLMISIKRFSIHMFVSHPYPNPAHSKEQWCHGFVNSLSPKHKDIYGLTLSQVNPRPQRGIHNFNITDEIIFIY